MRRRVGFAAVRKSGRSIHAGRNGVGRLRHAFSPESGGSARLAWVTKAIESQQIRDPFDLAYGEGGAIEPPIPLEMLQSLFEEQSIHSACVNAKAEDAVGGGWKLEAKGDQGSAAGQDATLAMKKALEDQLAGLCKELTWNALLLQAAIENESLGWAAWEITRGSGTVDPKRPNTFTRLGAMAGVYPLPGYTLRATKDNEVYVQLRGGKRVYFKSFGSDRRFSRQDPRKLPEGRTLAEQEEDEASEVLIFCTYSPRSSHYGVPRWTSAIPAITELAAIREHNMATFTGSGQTDRLIHCTGKTIATAQNLGDDVATQLKDAAGRAHATLVTNGTEDTTVNVQQLNPSTREGSYTRRREDVVKEVLIAHRVPPYRVGWAELGSLGGSAAEEMLRAYRLGAIEPLQGIFEQRLDQDFFGPLGLNLKGYIFRLEDVDYEQEDVDTAAATAQVGSAILTPNEARAKLKMPRSDNPAMDKNYLNGTPIEKAGEAPAGGFGFSAGGFPGTTGATGAPLVGQVLEEKAGDDNAMGDGDADATSQLGEEPEKVEAWGQRRVAEALRADRVAVVEAIRGARKPEAAAKAALEALEARREAWRTAIENVYVKAGARAAAKRWRWFLAEGLVKDPGAGPRSRRKAEKAGKKKPAKPAPAPGGSGGGGVATLPATGELPGPGLGVWEEEVQARLADAGATADKVTGVLDTTKDSIRSALTEGVSNLESIDQLAGRIDKLFLEQIIPNRSEIIARTEVLSAMGFGSRVSAQATGLTLEKRWLSTRDDRTRDAHDSGKHPDLEKWIPFDRPYVVGGQRMMYPGDSSLGASPDNTIQCRCDEVYREAGEKKSLKKYSPDQSRDDSGRFGEGGGGGGINIPSSTGTETDTGTKVSKPSVKGNVSENYKKLAEEEISKIPANVEKKLAQKNIKIVISETSSSADSKVRFGSEMDRSPAYYDPSSKTIVLNEYHVDVTSSGMKKVQNNDSYRRMTIHHEVGHAIDHALSEREFDPESKFKLGYSSGKSFSKSYREERSAFNKLPNTQEKRQAAYQLSYFVKGDHAQSETFAEIYAMRTTGREYDEADRLINKHFPKTVKLANSDLDKI